MFVYSFLEKNLACAILFDTVRLLIFENQDFLFFRYLLKKKSKLLSDCISMVCNYYVAVHHIVSRIFRMTGGAHTQSSQQQEDF